MTTQLTLVAGGAGFLGSHLCDRLLADGMEVLCVDNLQTGRLENLRHLEGDRRFRFVRADISEPLPAALSAAQVQPKQIFNLACAASPPHYQADPEHTMLTSVLGTRSLLRLAEATGGAGADVVLDIVGAKYLARNVAALAPGGRLAVIGMQGGTRAELDLSALLAKRGTITATSLRARPLAEKAAVVAAVREQVWPLLAQGRVRAVVDRTLPMAEAARAHRVMEAGEHVGKIVLTR